jgi:hypothetical protein
MSSITASSPSSISQFLQGAGRSRGGQRPQGGPPAEIRQQIEAQFKSAASELGISGEQFEKIGSQIREAVQGAAQNASGQSPEDLKASVDEKINGVLKDNGVDPKAFKEKFEQVADKLGLPKPGQGGPGGLSSPFGGGGLGGAQAYGANGKANADLIQTLLSSLTSGKGNDSSGLASAFSGKGSGSFVDLAA